MLCYVRQIRYHINAFYLENISLSVDSLILYESMENNEWAPERIESDAQLARNFQFFHSIFCLNGKFCFPFDDDQTSGDCAQLVAPWSFVSDGWSTAQCLLLPDCCEGRADNPQIWMCQDYPLASSWNEWQTIQGKSCVWKWCIVKEFDSNSGRKSVEDIFPYREGHSLCFGAVYLYVTQ